MKLHLIQMTSVPDVQSNLAFVEASLEQAQDVLEGGIVVLPECFALFGGRDIDNLAIAEHIGEGPVQTQLANLAKQFKVYLVAGSFPTKTDSPEKFSASCLVFSPTGELVTDYQKIHLFDVQVADGTGSYLESRTTEPGNKVVSFDTEFGRVGVAICYDLRFPALFQELAKQQVELVVLPSAFTQKTGEAHWHLLLQARAVENQFYIAGCNQTGVHANGRETYGHSLVADAWGNIISDAGTAPGLYSTELNLQKSADIREKMPVRRHNRFESNLRRK